MAKKGGLGGASFESDPDECPFREFRDNELAQELWGLGPAALKTALIQLQSKTAPKPPTDYIWVDNQTQPLPRSARQYLHGWIRAEQLAAQRWEAEVAVFDENEGKMSIREMQLTHAQVLLRSTFCRRVLSACFMLERCDNLPVEHQWENFVFSYGPEGWRAKYHIYSPGMKAGGGAQHKPGLSKSGCYLVRLFYLGAWRCVWVSDQVPVDANDSPLLPFSPLITHVPPPPPAKPGIKQRSTMVLSNVIYLWPLLLCKALLKLAAPDMTQDDFEIEGEDELMYEFDILHTLTGCMDVIFPFTSKDDLWKLLTQEVMMFSWDDDDETVTSTVKTKSTKKPTNKESNYSRQKSSMVSMLIEDTKLFPPYTLPGVTPGHEMTLLVSMVRDVPLKRPLQEPEVSPWKYYRWVDWAKRHGLYEAYECPRTKFLKVNGLMKMSFAPHLLDVQSTESITTGFRVEQSRNSKSIMQTKQKNKVDNESGHNAIQAVKEELREWVIFDNIEPLVLEVSVLYFPSMFHFTSAAYHPLPRPLTKAALNKAIDMPAPKYGPLYLQIDSPDENKLRMSLNMLQPRVMLNSGVPLDDYIEPAYLILEKFDWFEDCELPVAKGFVSTKGYNSVEVNFQPGRHFCRLWIHSRISWHVMLISESDLIMGTRDVIQAAAIHECPWASRFLSTLSTAFVNWIRMNRSNQNILEMDREFFKSYKPDLTWESEQVGYDQALLHWMFRQALQSLLSKRLGETDYRSVSLVLRRYFCDPDFGLPPKPKPPKSLREIIEADICDCTMPEVEEAEELEEQNVDQEQHIVEERPLVSPSKMRQLLTSPRAPITSHVCELATEELPCGVLKNEREKILKKHEAATCIQAHWRGTWARKCLSSRIVCTSDILKIMMDNAFGNMDSLSALMNEFFGMYPGAKKAYSVASALSGVYGLQQHSGTSPVTPVCRWVPYFQVVFYCHAPVKVHFDIQANLPNSVVAIYNNDTNKPLPQVYNAHITFDIVPNTYGYTVLAHGSLKQRPGYAFDAHWVLTILTSIDGVFHVCDNDPDDCHDLPFQPAYKLHIDEIFMPNRRNILGGILVSVTKQECISFKCTSTSPDLEMVATLKISSLEGEGPEIMRCEGKGEINWPYIRLLPSPPGELSPSMSTGLKKRSHVSQHVSQGTLSGISSARSLKQQKRTSPGKLNKSLTRLNKDTKPNAPAEPRQYSIEVTAPSGWPLTLHQWKRVEEVRHGLTSIKVEPTPKKPVRPQSTRQADRSAVPTAFPVYVPQPDDAYVELECSVGASANALARRDDTRDVRFATARKMWEIQEPGRNIRGEQIRAQFRDEFLEVPAPPPSESVIMEETFEETEEKKLDLSPQYPTPATESGLLESVETEEEARYLSKPELIRDKFIPLYFVPFCMKEKNEDESALLTNDMAEAAKRERHARIEAAGDRMKELQHFNEIFVIERQRKRCQVLEKLFVDSQYCDELMEKIEERDDAIALETLNRTLSASKKKADQKKGEQKQDKKK